MSCDYDAIVIGAGMSGLAAGIRLAFHDSRVAVLDRHYLWGGLNSFYRKGGYRFDVGLHALTNYVPRGARSAPLTRLLRQLRLRHEELDLVPQRGSRVQFPGKTLHFNNDFAFLESEVAREFPSQIDGFRRLAAFVRAYDIGDLTAPACSAREAIASWIADPLLADMLFCPLMYYGSASEDDMELAQFVVMFRSVFLEGFARPFRGVRHVLERVVGRFKELGGTLRMQCGVRRLIVEGARVAGVECDSGEVLTARWVLSSAGRVETLRLLSDSSNGAGPVREPPVGRLSFTESISVVDRQPALDGYDTTITFYSSRPEFRYRRPEAPCDLESGVIASPDNFLYDRPLPYSAMRVTSIARHDWWTGLADEQAYQAEKERWYRASVDEAVRHSYDFRDRVVFHDFFTPRTITRFTGHLGGAVYGTPEKARDGRTHLENLFLIGTDQGYLGVIGAMLSGITIANLHCLRGQRAEER